MDKYAENMGRLLQRTGNSQSLVFAFPQLEADAAYGAVLQEYGALSLPVFGPDDFLREDPIHLSPGGHRKLAEAISRVGLPSPRK